MSGITCLVLLIIVAVVIILFFAIHHRSKTLPPERQFTEQRFAPPTPRGANKRHRSGP